MLFRIKRRSLNNVLLTGSARSGTTLTCKLLNKLPNTIALSEPMDVRQFPSCQRTGDVHRVIQNFLSLNRKSLIESGKTISKHINGRIPDNSVYNEPATSGRRQSKVLLGEISFAKEISIDFLLVVKHCAAFTALLEILKKRYRCYGIVRNPLATLASWNSVEMNVSNGRIPAAEQIDSDLRIRLDAIENVFDRQIYVLSWMYSKYEKFLSLNEVIFYEQIVESCGRELSKITAEALQLNESLKNKNLNRHYNADLISLLGQKLLDTEGSIWAFYSREEVEDLMDQWEKIK